MLKTHSEEIITPELNGFGEPISTGSVLADKRGLSTSLSESLGSLALGILVIAGLAVGIGAAYNYGQDSSAKSNLDAVKSAQILHQGKTGTFGDISALSTGEDPALTKTAPSLAVTVGDRNFCAAIESGSMFKTNYWLTSKTGEVLTTKPTPAEAGVTCPDPITS